MKKLPIVADENIDFRLIRRLRENGFEVFSINESDFGIQDTSVLSIANERQSFLITEDKDFGNLAIRDHQPHQGILLIRRKRITVLEQIEIVINLLDTRLSELSHRFAVLRDRNLVIRE